MKKLLFLLPVLVLLAGCIKVQESTPTNPIGQIGTEIALKNIVPASDVQGEDLEVVPRPSGFVRADYYHEEGRTEISYRAWGDKFNQVYEFYKNEMPKKGWSLESEETGAGAGIEVGGVSGGVIKGATLRYIRSDGDEEVTIEIVLAEIMNKKITDVGITYSYGLNSDYEEEQESSIYKPLDKEPYIHGVPIYEGAVLYDRSKMTLGGITQYTDKYYVKGGDVEEVFNFYDQMNAIDGIPKFASQIQGESATVFFGTNEGDLGISINIEKEGDYVIIEIMKTEAQ